MSSATTGPRATKRPDLAVRLDGFFESQRSKATRFGPDFERLWELTGRTVRGGKLVRPKLLLDLYEALRPPAQNDSETVADLAVALELLHYAFLLHDDVIDGDMMRRGAPNLIGALFGERGQARGSRSLHLARTGGILMGDMLLAASHQIFAQVKVPGPQHLRLLGLLDDTVVESVAGEFTDVGLGDGFVEPDLHTVLAMTERKTATYTFELPMRMAAVLNYVPACVEDRLGAIGRHLGLGFQLQDDLLCAFGDPAIHGKDVFSDLREAKQTAIIAFARRTESWPLIEPALGRRNLSQDEAISISRLLAECGARQWVEDLVETELRHARSLTDGGPSPLPDSARLVLTRLIADLEGRRS